jgi:hypothetical protein
MTETEKAIRDFCGHHADWWPSTTQVQEMLVLAQPEQEPAIGDIRALKHRIHALEGEVIGYKQIVADQDALLLRNAERIVDLQTHIANLEGEDR